MILSLDTASKTGWAIAAEGRIIESGVQDFTKRRGESNGMLFLKFRRWLSDLLTHQRPDAVVYEQAHFRGGAATEVCVGLQTRVQEICEEQGVPYTAVHTATVKKYATGKGNAGKPEMVKWAEMTLGRPPIDDNEADAVSMALWGWDEYGE